MTHVLAEAANRGQIDPAVISDEIRDLLPGYLLFRFLIPGPPPTVETVRELVDDVLMPGLTRHPEQASATIASHVSAPAMSEAAP